VGAIDMTKEAAFYRQLFKLYFDVCVMENDRFSGGFVMVWEDFSLCETTS